MSRPTKTLDEGEFGKLALTSAVTSFLAVFVPSIVVFVTSTSSYAGASDTKIVDAATTRYATYLQEVAGLAALTTLVGWLIVAVATLGVVLALRVRKPAWFSHRRLRFLVPSAVALAAAALYAGFGVQRHPGLFLAALSGSSLLQVAVEACVVLAPLFAIGAIFGYGLAFYHGTRRLLFSPLVALAVLVGASIGLRGYIAARLLPATFRPPGAPVPSLGKAPATDAKKPISPSILWIAVDSLRPDRVDRENTPNLARLLEESVYFDHAIVPVPRTGPSWTAALTSMSPLSNGVETMFPSQDKGQLATFAMPSHLASNGYATLVTSEYAGEFFGRVDLGFQVKAVPRAELMQISGQMLLARSPFTLAHLGLWYSAGQAPRAALPPILTELMRGLPNFSQSDVMRDDVAVFLADPATKNRPVFMLAFYSQPHFPYTSSPKFAKRYHVRGSSAALAYGRDVVNEIPIVSKEDRAQLDGLYRAALAETDEAVGRLIATLGDRANDTIIIISADHGEGLYECATCVGHGDNLRGTMTLRVPLAFHLPKAHFPKAEPKVVHDYVSTLDVYPSVLDLLGIRQVATHEGVSLFTSTGTVRSTPKRKLFVETGEWLWETAAVPKDRVAYPPITELAHLENDRIAIDPKFDGAIRAAKHRAVIAPPYKLTYEPTKDGVRYGLYDVEADPTDDHDLSSEHPEVVKELREALRREVLGHAHLLPVGDYFITRPEMPNDEHW